MLERRTHLREEKLWSVFRMFDTDGSGSIDKEELSEVLAHDAVNGLVKEVKYMKFKIFPNN